MIKVQIDILIGDLFKITSNFIYAEYYSHTDCVMWKIDNEYTKYAKDKIVLCPVSEGIEKALVLALAMIAKHKNEFENSL